MKKRMFALLVALAMVCAILAGCGAQSASSPAAASEEETATQAVSAEESAAAAEAQVEPEQAEEPDASGEAEEASAAEPEDGPDYREPLSYPLANGDVSFTILHAEPALGPMSGQMGMSTYGDFDTIAAGTEYIGVTPEWQALSMMSGDTQFNLIVASGDYPDVFTAIDKYYAGGFAKALEDEVIIRIEDEDMASNMPEYWNMLEDDADLKRAVTSDDGEFLAWYSVFDKTIVNEGYFIRKDWCDKLGMDVPETIDDLNDFVYAAKSEFDLPSVLVMGDGLGTMVEAYGIGSTVSSGAGFAYHREGDAIVADITSPVYHEYVEQLHQWYADGIVSQNFTELDTGNMSGDIERELAANRTAVVRTMVNSMDNLLNDDPDFELAPMVVTLDGGNIHTGQGERQFDSCSISTRCDEDLIPYILGWMNYWYTEEGAMAGSYGVEGLDYEVNADGSISYLPNITENALGYPPMLYSRARCFSGASFGLMYQDRTVPFFTEAQTNAIDVWTSRTDNAAAVPQTLSLNTEESQVVAQYATDLATYISEVIPKFVTGEKPLSEWNAFMDDISGMHVDELTAVYQAAFDRYYD